MAKGWKKDNPRCIKISADLTPERKRTCLEG
jgi:hypothetical protein